jgi:hypothetical protein
MHKFILSCFFILAVCPLGHAQDGDYQFQFDLDNTVYKWVQSSDTTWFGIGWSRTYMGYPRATPFVIKFNARKDSVEWRKQVPADYAEIIWDMDALPTAEGGLFLGIVYDGCDYTVSDGLAKLDINGNVLWFKKTPNNDFTQKVWLVPYPDGHILYQTSSYQIEYEPDGHLLWSDAVNFKWDGFIKRSNNSYFLWGDHKLGKSGLLLSFVEYPIDDHIRDGVRLPTGNWLLLGNQYLYRVGYDFNIVAKKAVSDVRPWSKIVKTDTTYWITGQNNAGFSFIKSIDTLSLNVKNSFYQNKNLDIQDVLFIPGDSVLWLSGNGNSERNQTVYLKSVPMDAPVIQANRDIAVTDIRLDIIPYSNYQECQGIYGPENYRLDFGTVYATVQNNGTTAVQHFKVNAKFSKCSFICETFDTYSFDFEEPLLPGASKELIIFPQLDVAGQEDLPFFSLCLWTSLPDDRLDANPNNDRFCKFVDVVVGDQEALSLKGAIRVSPNPAQDYLLFSLDHLDNEIQDCQFVLTDIAGKTVANATFNGNQYRFERNNLPSGLYFYQIHQGGVVLGVGKVTFF